MRSLLFTSLFFGFHYFLMAQNTNNNCLEVELSSGTRSEMLIDSINQYGIYYRKCDKPEGRRYKSDLTYVRKIYFIQGPVHPLTERLQILRKIGTSKLDRWVFKRFNKKAVRVFSRGQKVKIFYFKENGFIKKEQGTLSDITADSLVLKTSVGIEVAINKERIKMIRRNSKVSILSALGVLLLGIIGLIYAFSLIFENFLSTNSEGEGLGCLSALIIIAGIILLITNINGRRIQSPFDGTWQIEYFDGPQQP